MNEIVLDEFYTLKSDNVQWIMYYEKETGEINSRTGKPIVSKDQWYFNRLGQALYSYIDKKLKEEESIDSMILALNELLIKAKELEAPTYPQQ